MLLRGAVGVNCKRGASTENQVAGGTWAKGCVLDDCGRNLTCYEYPYLDRGKKSSYIINNIIVSY